MLQLCTALVLATQLAGTHKAPQALVVTVLAQDAEDFRVGESPVDVFDREDVSMDEITVDVIDGLEIVLEEKLSWKELLGSSLVCVGPFDGSIFVSGLSLGEGSGLVLGLESGFGFGSCPGFGSGSPAEGLGGVRDGRMSSMSSVFLTPPEMLSSSLRNFWMAHDKDNAESRSEKMFLPEHENPGFGRFGNLIRRA